MLSVTKVKISQYLGCFLLFSKVWEERRKNKGKVSLLYFTLLNLPTGFSSYVISGFASFYSQQESCLQGVQADEQLV